MSSKVAEEVFHASKLASQYFEKVDKTLLYHASALQGTDWFLCNRKDADTSSTPPPSPIPWIGGLSPPDVDDFYVVAIPHTFVHSKHYTPSEVHQVIRELVHGIYVFNQTPSISFESNYDCSSACILPSAYVDTFLGQCLFNIDYFVKSLLHGNTVPQREKRLRLNEKWRKVVSENPSGLHDLYQEHGALKMEDDDELGSALYDDSLTPYYRFPPELVDSDLSALNLTPRFSTSEDHHNHTKYISHDVFLRYLDQVSLSLVLEQGPLQQDGSLLVINPRYDVQSKVHVHHIQNDENILTHLHVYLQKQIDFIKKNLTKKTSVAHILELLHFASFLVLLFATLKQQHKTVDCNKLQPAMNSDLLTTERELPPFLPTKSSRWSSYTSNNHYTSAKGGISFHKECIEVVPLQHELKGAKDEILSKAKERDVAMVTVNGKTYTVVGFRLDNYYPKFPRWIHAMVQELQSQCSKLPAMSDSRVQEFLRRPLGLRNASKLKTINASLRPCIDKNLTGCVAAMLKRCTKTRINKPDEEDGLALIHYASACGRSEVMSLIIHNVGGVNQPSHLSPDSPSQTLPIHLASQSGDIDSVCCLLKYNAEAFVIDDRGWSPIHYAAYHNYHVIVSHFARLSKECINVVTSGRDRTTPLLLAAENGGLSSVKCLVGFEADLFATNGSQHNVVQIATLKHHVNILQYIVSLDVLPVWNILADMLKADPSTKFPQASSRCLDALLRWNSSYYDVIISNGAVQQLVELTKSSDENLQLLSTQVLADISCMAPVKDILVSAIPVFVKHLSSRDDRLQSCACIVLSDLALQSSNQKLIADSNGIKPLIDLLSSPQDDIQLYSVACLGILAMNNNDIKTLIREINGLPLIVSLLSSPTICIQGCAAACMQVLLDGCYENQLAVLSEGIIDPLVLLLRSKTTSVHTNAACAIESLAFQCSSAQRLLQDEATSSQCLTYLRRLLKTRNSEVKVCCASALWAIAGSQIEKRRQIANFIGIDTLVDLLTTPNDKIYYVCSEALGTLATELGNNQNHIAELGGILPLVDVILCQTSEKVHISILNTLGLLLTKPGLVPNVVLQKAIVDARGISLITALVLSPLSEMIRVKAACTLAKLVLNNSEYEQKLSEQPGFSYSSFLKLLESSDINVQLLAGYALSIFVFNSSEKLQIFKSSGVSLSVSNFITFLSSDNETHQVHAAFQLVILSKLLAGIRDVDASIHGIKLLIRLSISPLEKTKLYCFEFLACLSRCREGIPLTTVMAGAITPLLDALLCKNPPLEEAASAALGFFTYQSLAARLIRSRFRSEPELYHIFHKYLKDINVSHQFINEWLYLEKVGLPSLSLEKRGGPAIGQGWRTNVPKMHSIEKSRTTHEKIYLHTLPSIEMDYSTQTQKTGLLMQRKIALMRDSQSQ